MKIVADDKIPFLKGVLEPFADVEYVPGNMITNEHVKDADALIIRTRTQCNEKLLKGPAFNSLVRLPSDTIISIHNSVKIMVLSGKMLRAAMLHRSISILHLHCSIWLIEFGFPLQDRVLGVVGVGNVGSKVVHTAEMLDMRVYLCDPPRVRRRCLWIYFTGWHIQGM